jgi:hypothetical protein
MEIGSQLEECAMGTSAVRGLYHMVAVNESGAWPLLLSFSDLQFNSSTTRLFNKYFEAVQMPHVLWRDHFGISRRSNVVPRFYQSMDMVPNPSPGRFDARKVSALTWRVHDILSPSTSGFIDGLITPSIYGARMLPMPASLARYATMFYASSLVRYRPSIFDNQKFPQHAYLFDAIARECALPILIDTLIGIEGEPQLFYAEDSLRL